MNDNTDLVFGIAIYNEGVAQLDWCLSNLRNVYPEVQAFVVSDGASAELVSQYQGCCQEHQVRCVEGQRLKALEQGALWWKRFLDLSLEYPAQYIFKMDPDTCLRRRFEFFAPFDIAGTLEGDNIQGGIQCLRRSAAIRISDSGICLDVSFRDRKWEYRRGEACSDRLLCHIRKKLGLTVGNWTEVDSLWKATRPPRVDAAATHPHKLQQTG